MKWTIKFNQKNDLASMSLVRKLTSSAFPFCSASWIVVLPSGIGRFGLLILTAMASAILECPFPANKCIGVSGTGFSGKDDKGK